MIDVVGELKTLGIEYSGSDDRIKVCCPFHEDSNPSCSINLKSSRFDCFSCKATGDLTLLLFKLRKDPTIAATRKYIQQKYGVNTDKLIAPSLIEDCHEAIWKHDDLLAELSARSVDKGLVTQFRLGYQNGKITIPITNSSGFYVDLRRYSPGAEKNKFCSMKGYGGNYIFPHNQLDKDKVVIVGGEIKAIACTKVLNPAGYGVITSTAGEGSFEAAWVDLIRDKTVYVIMDMDEHGRKAAQKICHMVSNAVAAVHDVELTGKLPDKAGPDDFLAAGGDLVKLLQESKPWEPAADDLINSTAKKISLPQAFSAKESGERVTYKGVVDCIGESIYHVPKKLEILCDKSQPECTLCTRVFPCKDNLFVMHPESAFILETAGCSKASQGIAVRDALSIPQTCRAWTYEVKERYSVEDVRVSSELDISHREVEREMQPAFIVRDEDEQPIFSNETYEFTGRTWPSPKNQEAISVISDYKLVESALESYECKDKERLQVFQPLEWTVEAIREKLNHIYTDFEANVTMIHQRREIHLAVDLVYHSPLFFRFDGKEQNGWASCLIIGDTSQGKSEVPKMMMDHYRLGTKIEAGSTSAAGILGGIDKINGAFFTTWGVMPQQDKRLLFIDELSENKDESLLGRMNDARSSGLVQITKIKKATARARTRTIMASNCRNGRSMDSYGNGVEAIPDLIGHPQYVRRFDFSVVIQKNEVDGEYLQTYRPVAPHIYTSELCNELVLWTWTTKDVQFEDQKYILDAAVTLTKKYDESIPLVDKGSMRLKVARLAAAVAARTYSCTPEGGLLVRNCHVQYIVEFLDKMYSKPAFGYEDYSKVQKDLETLRNPDHLLKRINQLRYPRDFVEGIMRVNTIDVQSIIDLIEADRSEAQSMLSVLFRHRAVKRQGRQYYKTGQFTTQLKKWASNGCLTDKPAHIPDDFGDSL